MVICFNCCERTKKALDSLMASRQHKDYQEAISFAIQNQSILQKEVSEKGYLVVGKGATRGSQVAGSKPWPRQSASSGSQGDLTSEEGTVLEVHSHPSPVIPSLFVVDGLAEARFEPAPLPIDRWVMRQEVPLERWVLGQYNKLLPAKANCRALAHLLDRQQKGVPIDDTALEIAKEAVALGQYLRQLDTQTGADRDEAFATAFPKEGKRAEKSLLRYANQFVASVNTQGQVSGLLIDLKLINHKNGKGKRLFLTDAGWQFSLIPNPILDQPGEKAQTKFSTDERHFLTDHISSNVPAEDFAFRAILTAISAGANTPDTIDVALERYVSEEGKENLSKSFLSSQRSGAISRMADLGLVKRNREGVRVSYEMTDIGRGYGGL